MDNHFDCLRDSLEINVIRERQNIQSAFIHLFVNLDEFMLKCKDRELLKKIERERLFLKHSIIQIYNSIDYLKEILKPVEWTGERLKYYDRP